MIQTTYAEALTSLAQLMDEVTDNRDVVIIQRDDAEDVALIAAAMLGGFGGGFLVDRFGPKRVLMADIIVWMLLFALAAAIPLLKLPSALFWLVASLAGFALGCLWSADRPLMLRLSPPRYLGQFYGLYSMVGRFASVIGPIMWGFIVNTLNWGRPAAILSLLILMIGAFVLLLPVPGGVHRWGPEDLPERA